MKDLYVWEPYTRGADVRHPISSSKRARSSRLFGGLISAPLASHYSQGGFLMASILQKEGHASPRIHSHAALETMIQSATQHNFMSSPYAPTRLSILPVLKRLAACIDLSRRSFAQPMYVLLQAPPDLLCLVLFDTTR